MAPQGSRRSRSGKRGHAADSAAALDGGGVSPTAGRLAQLDGLRALAALAVLAFHFTTRFDERHGHAVALGWSWPWGMAGVELFFAISGFVIHMTLDRVRGPWDFVVLRFARLYPTFWAALLLTTAVLWLAGPEAAKPDLRQLAWNLTMMAETLGQRLVDGVYWSLEVELLFYAAMLAASVTGLTRRGPGWLLAWLGLAAAEPLLKLVGAPAWPYRLTHLALLAWIAWFALGMAAYHWRRDGRLRPAAMAVVAAALAVVALRQGAATAAGAALVFGAVALAGQGRLHGLDAPGLVALGAGSYPLYLVHQEIGMLAIRWLEGAGLGPMAAIALTTLGTVALAALLHWAVERPSMAWARRRRSS
jgi:peptidoglycan/LPS O-acetylase OafA/YrhL